MATKKSKTVVKKTPIKKVEKKNPNVKSKTIATKKVKSVAKKKALVKAKPEAKKNSKKIVTIADLSDEQIESCFDGSSNVDLVRDLFEENYHSDLNVVDETAFGEAFADAIQGFIGVDQNEEPEEWKQAYAINQEWGESIAQNVNELLKELNS